MIYPSLSDLLGLEHKAKKMIISKSNYNFLTAGENNSNNYGSGLEFKEIRKYVFGDDLRSIDWKTTARTNSVYSKLFQIQTEKNINVVVDLNSNMHFGTRTTFKSIQASRISALILWFFFKNQDRIGGVVFGSKNSIDLFPPKKNKNSLLKLLACLCKEKVSNNYISLAQAIEAGNIIKYNSSRLYIISDFINFDYDRNLKLFTKILKKNIKIYLLQVTDERDYIIPNIGVISFFDYKNNNKVINTNSKIGRQRYQQIWQSNQNKILNITNKLNINFLQIKTNDNVYSKLTLFKI